MRCPKCSAEMVQITDDNREFHICTNCKIYYGSDIYKKSKFDDTVILQIDGGIITGLLVFLTLTSLIPILSTPFNNITTIIITASVIFPFAISAILVLSNHIERPSLLPKKFLQKYSRYAVNLTCWGFGYLMLSLVILFGFNLASPLINGPTPPLIKACKKNVTDFFNNTSNDICTKIKPGSLYEECVKKAMPNVSECSKFMVD
jgi:hypothetical protein